MADDGKGSAEDWNKCKFNPNYLHLGAHVMADYMCGEVYVPPEYDEQGNKRTFIWTGSDGKLYVKGTSERISSAPPKSDAWDAEIVDKVLPDGRIYRYVNAWTSKKLFDELYNAWYFSNWTNSWTAAFMENPSYDAWNIHYFYPTPQVFRFGGASPPAVFGGGRPFYQAKIWRVKDSETPELLDPKTCSPYPNSGGGGGGYSGGNAPPPPDKREKDCMCCDCNDIATMIARQLAESSSQIESLKDFIQKTAIEQVQLNQKQLQAISIDLDLQPVVNRINEVENNLWNGIRK